MNYKEFLEYKKNILEKNPQLIDLTENNLYKSLEYLKPKEEDHERAYRCHVAEKYLKRINQPDKLKKQVVVNLGVRHSLEYLFSKFNNWIVPEEQYPWYKQKLQELNKEVREYKTLKQKELFKDIEEGSLLLTYPLKLSNRCLTSKEIHNLKTFLNKKSENKVFIDLVYWMNRKIPKKIMELYKNSNQVYLIYSFSKTFLLPYHCGFMFLPKSKENEAREFFIKQPKEERRLSLINHLLDTDSKLEEKIKEVLIHNQKELNKKGFNFKIKKKNPSYLFYSPRSFNYYLKKGFLTIPEEVFGGKGKGVVVSSLVPFKDHGI